MVLTWEIGAEVEGTNLMPETALATALLAKTHSATGTSVVWITT